MSKWEEKRLEDIIDVNPPVKLKKGESYPFIDIDKVSPTRRSVTNEEVKVYDGQSSSKFCDGDTVFSRITPCLENRKIAKVAIDGDAAFGSTEFYVFRAKKKKADARFTYYLTSSDAVVLPAINSMTGASGRQRADKRFIQRLKLNLPDLPTQERIADILSAYDDLIEANNRRIELLEQTAQELYKEWFVRFRFPGYENAKFENGLPKGWNVVKLGDYVDIKGGKRLPEGKTLCGRITEHPYIRIRDITASKFISLTNSFEYIDDETFDIIQRFTVNTNDVLVSIVGTIGAIACVGKSLDGANLTENCVKLVNVRHFTNSFLYHFLNSDAGKGAIQAGIVGATQPKLPLYNIKRIKLLKPDAYLIVAFTEVIEPIDREIITLMDKNRNLATQRDMLLPRLMSGKLEV
ncbi:MAG: restriction endonuclease subunit S [Oscillospiraceae bacterium]|nr:restriction endonuclease subunit S [Oscillospiraceae bacterium]MDY4624161.1 restriction endonuclease subunit S [Oscillospiraceae bacterium]